MSTVDDLRSTLEDRARAVDDPGASPRVVAVHERVRGLRRRRRATAAVLAAAVAVAGVGVGSRVLLDDGAGPEPAGPPQVVAGQQVPGSVTVGGSEYDYVSAAEKGSDDDRLVLRLSPSERLRAVSLVASDLGEGWATLRHDDRPAARLLGEGGSSAAVPVEGERPRLVVDLHGVPDEARVGLAVFERTGVPAASVVADDGSAYFRPTVDDAELLDAAFGEPGQGEVSLTVRTSLDDLQTSDFCRTEAKGLWVKTSIDGGGWSGGRCSPGGDDQQVDAAASHSSPGSTGSPVREHTVRAYVTRGFEGTEPVSDASTVLGLGVYEQGARERVLGMDVPGTVDSDGRRWRIDQVLPATDAQGVLTTLPAQDEAVLLGMVARGGAGGALRWRGSVSGRADDGTRYLVSRGSGYGLEGQLLPGEEWTLRVLQQRAEKPTEVAVLLYRPVS